jgi:hypothetical protein
MPKMCYRVASIPFEEIPSMKHYPVGAFFPYRISVELPSHRLIGFVGKTSNRVLRLIKNDPGSTIFGIGIAIIDPDPIFLLSPPLF